MSCYYIVSIHRQQGLNWGFCVKDRDDALGTLKPPKGQYGMVQIPQQVMTQYKLKLGQQSTAPAVRTTGSASSETVRMSQVTGSFPDARPDWFPHMATRFPLLHLHNQLSAPSPASSSVRSRSAPPSRPASTGDIPVRATARSTTPIAPQALFQSPRPRSATPGASRPQSTAAAATQVASAVVPRPAAGPSRNDMSTTHFIVEVVSSREGRIDYVWKPTGGAHKLAMALLTFGQSIPAPGTYCVVHPQRESTVVCSLGPDKHVRGVIWRVQPTASGTFDLWFDIHYLDRHSGRFYHLNKVSVGPTVDWLDPATRQPRPPQVGDELQCSRVTGNNLNQIEWSATTCRQVIQLRLRAAGFGPARVSTLPVPARTSSFAGQPPRRVDTF